MGSSPPVIPSFIGGKDVFSSSTFTVTNPATGESCWHVSSATEQEARHAVDVAQEAFPSWADTPPPERQALLFKAAELMEQRADELVETMCTEMGTDPAIARSLVVMGSIAMLRDIACRTTSDLDGSVPVVSTKGQRGMVWKEPYGVVLGIVPWNAPHVFGVRSAATAIATGNTTVLKASELAPKSFYSLVKVFHDAGVPAGVVNVLSCSRSEATTVVNAMIEHPSIKKVNFTGSSAVGRKISQHCGLHLKPTLMELGGKNSAIILPDADLQKAAQECLIGAFANSGQVCMSTDLILIHKDIVTQFLETLKQTLTAMQASSDTLPVVVTSHSASRIAALIQDATKKGGEVFHGGPPPEGEKSARVIPTVLGGLSDDMNLWQDEAFGPMLGYKVFSDEEEAIKLAKSPGYGLSGSVFTRDLRKALAIARRLETGQVHINAMTVNAAFGVPFGGIRDSGWGRFNAREGMEEFLVTKTVTWDD